MSTLTVQQVQHLRSLVPGQVVQALQGYRQEHRPRILQQLLPEVARAVRALLLMRLLLGQRLSTPEREQRLAFPEDGYDLTHDPAVLPKSLLHARCSKFFIEFLKVDTTGMSVERAQNAKNHVIFKIDLEEPVDGYTGVRVSMDIDFDVGSSPSGFKPGHILVKPVQYDMSSRSSARTLQARITPGKRLGDIITAIVGAGLHKFHFTNKKEKYFGCRDFM